MPAGSPLTARPPCSGDATLISRVELDMQVAEPARRLRGAAIENYLLKRAENAILAPEAQGAILSSL